MVESKTSEFIRLRDTKQSFIDLDLIIDSGTATTSEIESRNSLFKEQEDLMRYNSLDALQKSRVKWDIEGDENSKFFHCSLKRKRKQQHIHGLMINGIWVTDPATIKMKFLDYFSAKFERKQSTVHFEPVNPLRSLSAEDSSFLEADFGEDEIKKAVWECGSSKAPGPDGLACVIDKIISPEQSAFIAGRQILDGPLMLSEIVSWYKKKNQKALFFKVDFEKAYDSVNWDYLFCMLTTLGFGSKWVSWIKGCLVSARTSVLVNGNPTREFSINRGLRQGDPLSPFLFIIVMEGLHIAFQQAMDIDFVRGIKIGVDNNSIIFCVYFMLFIWSRG
ncbi:uncharacterized protein [Rutidosis leptorrhynchoides]|uniref:uncharacterized protein n=1 Tax=Rutidosis leptorrhynchoides TaxID=125765 RepID=UPI003A9A54F2